eukprot:Gb_12874 [translate_table: standard]
MSKLPITSLDFSFFDGKRTPGGRGGYSKVEWRRSPASVPRWNIPPHSNVDSFHVGTGQRGRRPLPIPTWNRVTGASSSPSVLTWNGGRSPAHVHSTLEQWGGGHPRLQHGMEAGIMPSYLYSTLEWGGKVKPWLAPSIQTDDIIQPTTMKYAIYIIYQLPLSAMCNLLGLKESFTALDGETPSRSRADSGKMMRVMKQLNLHNCSTSRPKSFTWCMFFNSNSLSTSQINVPSSEIDRICKIINDHPFPNSVLESSLHQNNITLSTTLVENVLGRLFSGHVNGSKAFQFFHWASKQNPDYQHNSNAYEKMLHILARMKDFDKVWELLEEMHENNKITKKALSIVLSKYARLRSFDETLEAFERMERYLGKVDTDAFNVLLQAFCTQRHMKEARGVFNRMHHRFSPNTQTFNILLLGFKESCNATAAEIFFRDMIRRGCNPDAVTYNILIDALCKDRRIDNAFELVDVMKRRGCNLTIRTYTTLIHGLGIVRNVERARQVFVEITMNGFEPDTAAYNALISCFCKAGRVEDGLKLMDEMGSKGLCCDDMTYHTVFSAFLNLNKEEEVCELFTKMVAGDCVPKVSTATKLMKFFCSSGRHDMAFDLWNYVIQKGSCPHGHVSDLLITELCYSGKLQEAYDCCREIIEKGRHPYWQSYNMLQRFFKHTGRLNQLSDLLEKMKQLQCSLPASEGYISNLSLYENENVAVDRCS